MQNKAAGQGIGTAERVSLWAHRIIILLVFLMIFFPAFNPGRISEKINKNITLITSATSYGTVVSQLEAYIVDGPQKSLEAASIHRSMAGCAMILAGVLLSGAGACLSLGNRKMRRLGVVFPAAGGLLVLGGLWVLRGAYQSIISYISADAQWGAQRMGLVQPVWPVTAVTAFLVAGILVLATTALVVLFAYRGQAEEKYDMDEKFRLFIMLLPVLILSFVFAYLPIYGWRYAFYQAKAGDTLSAANYVGWGNFSMLINNPGIRSDILRVLRNTLIMSGLGIATSWLPIAFAILLAELRSTKFQRTVQTLTTIPNFLSWVLVYAVAFSIFSTGGFVNNFLNLLAGSRVHNTDYLAESSLIWIKMLLWGTWKGLGWSAIIYVAGIAGIDQQLYEAARVDGANRFRCIWHITIPGLMPTYMVMLLMSVAGILSNGMEQYLVFENPKNTAAIEVLDLYVYHLGMKSNDLSTSTVIGILKSLVGVTLLFGANGISKAVRGESII